MADNSKAEKIAQLQETIKKLTEEQKKNPSAELELRLNRETDLLRHLNNTAIGNAKDRSHETAEVARIVALSRAVQPV